MPHTTYIPGDATAIVTQHGAVLVDAQLPPALATRLWEQLDEGRGLAAVLDALVGAFGTSMTAIPAFAVALDEGRALRLAARGAFHVVAGEEVVSGEGVTTWSERVVPATRAALRMPGADVGADSALPLRDGVVRARLVAIGDRVAAPDDQATSHRAATVVQGVLAHDAEIAAETLAPEALAPEQETLGAEHLAETVIRPSGPAAPAEPAVLGDHDGLTVSVAQARAQRGDAASRADAGSPPPPL
ncbi:MAG: hypothetical protein QM611_10945, partial [Microbacterium sp.]